MRSTALSSLIDIPIAVIVSNKDAPPIRPGGRFELPVVLINRGDRPIGWSKANPLTMSYRWLSEDGETLERDGRRTAIPVSSIPPGSRVEFDIVGISPEHEGCYELQLSLVLEDIHWACDVESSGWVQRVTNVTPAPAWPAGLKDSHGARALRGALVAAELERHLEKRTFAVKSVATEAVTETTPALTLTDERRSLFHPARDWLRAMLGVRGLEQQLADVFALASGQEQRARELETQIGTLKQELQIDLELLKGRVAQPNQNPDATRCDAPIAGSDVVSRQTAANVSQAASRLSKGSSKLSKTSRKPTR